MCWIFLPSSFCHTTLQGSQTELPAGAGQVAHMGKAAGGGGGGGGGVGRGGGDWGQPEEGGPLLSSSFELLCGITESLFPHPLIF